MGHSRLSNEEIARRGEEIYEERLRDKVETTDNIGKIIVIDTETGDYEIDDNGLEASHRALARNPNAVLFGWRIGYDAVEGFGGGPVRVKR
jgi:hypothetical protein